MIASFNPSSRNSSPVRSNDASVVKDVISPMALAVASSLESKVGSSISFEENSHESLTGNQRSLKRQKLSSPTLIEMIRDSKKWRWSAVMEHLRMNSEATKRLDQNGRLPLHIACFHNAPSNVIEECLRLNPAAVRSKDNDGRLPLHVLFYMQNGDSIA